MRRWKIQMEFPSLIGTVHSTRRTVRIAHVNSVIQISYGESPQLEPPMLQSERRHCPLKNSYQRIADSGAGGCTTISRHSVALGCVGKGIRDPFQALRGTGCVGICLAAFRRTGRSLLGAESAVYKGIASTPTVRYASVCIGMLWR